MANIMSMADIKNRPSRNGFDLSTKRNFSAKVGELLPVWHTAVLPGDKININLKNFTRTQPLNTAAFARMREYYDFFFVPYELLWNKFGTTITQMNANSQHATSLMANDSLSGKLPYITSEQIAMYLSNLSYNDSEQDLNPFGFFRSDLTSKLLEYLGYGDYSIFTDGSTTWSSKPLMYNLECSLFPLLAYQKIYSDYFRYTQWERSNPSTFNVDYIKGTNDLNLDITELSHYPDFNFFDLRYCNYQKDLFHGVVPVAQYGSAASVPVNSSLLLTGADITLNRQYWDGQVHDPRALIAGTTRTDGKFGLGEASTAGTGIESVLGNTFDINAKNSSLQSNITVLALRQAEFLQKWKEVAVSAEEDYKSQIQKHWGVSVSDYLSGQCRYLGGTATSLDINEVVNTNITGDNAADIAGKGTFAGGGSIHFESNGQYGIIMCIYHALPIVDYVGSGVNPFTTLVDATSYPVPELDQIGMELVPLVRAMNPVKDTSNLPSANTFLGYAPRYISWKTDVDKSVGAFTKTLRTWCLPMGDKELSAANSFNFSDNPNIEPNSVAAGFFKVNPSIVDSLFGVKADSTVDTDHFLCSSFFDVKVVRNLDINGLPY